MTIATYFRAQAYNNAWANHRLLTACAALSPADLAAPRTNFFPSLIETLNHILLVDRFYLDGLEGRHGPAPFDWSKTIEAMADLDRAQRATDRRLIGFCQDLDEDALSRPVDLPRKDRIQIERVDRILLHLFQHQIHHRGQVHAMLAGTGLAPPQLDEFFLADEREQALRAADFAALGFDEDEIWR